MLNSKHGFTLIELLLSLSLISIIIIQLLTNYLSAGKNLALQNELMSAIQKTLRLNHILKQQIHVAGYIGCPKLTPSFPILRVNDKQLTYQNKIKIKSNQLIVRYADLSANRLLNQDNDLLLTNRNKNLHVSDVILVSDCRFAELAIVKQLKINALQQSIKLASPLSHIYKQHATVAKLITNTIFFENNTIYLRNIKNERIAMVSGINQFEWFYAIKRNNQLLKIKASSLNVNDVILGIFANWSFQGKQKKITWPFFARVLH